MRTSDSLSRNESYFYAELKRLKLLIERIAEGKEVFVLLDEILKGTNTTYKLKGSVALLKQMISMGSSGTDPDRGKTRVDNLIINCRIHEAGI